MLRVPASIGVCVLANLLVSCEGADDGNNVDLSILEWSGYQQEQYHPEYNAKYGGQPGIALFAEEKDAMQRMRNGYQVDLVHLCVNSLDEAQAAGLRPRDAPSPRDGR